MTDAINPTDVRRAAMDLLYRREHLRAELETKLRKRFFDAAVAAVADETLTADSDETLTADSDETLTADSDETLTADSDNTLKALADEILAAIVAETLDSLARENLQCDQRYCDSYVRQRSNRGYGPQRIRQELRQKGAASDYIALAIAVCETDWFALARLTRRKKFGPELPADYTEKSRQLRFLQYRGFGGDYTREVFSNDY